eukprot:TRINITY_DN3005_c0_g1_i3.p1 TRINITY_DN3005_c0_g1~~TRINITY_DN3005_c0_g1_i3.p1  ORF type:complete len:285 (+),score=77.44 TRINITY_DN3005_c0_g1_i3:1085-1939(+)
MPEEEDDEDDDSNVDMFKADGLFAPSQHQILQHDMNHNKGVFIVAMAICIVGVMSCAVDNDCVSGGQTSTPFCVVTDKSGTKQCRACREQCDCPIGQYCANDYDHWDSDTTGTCKTIDSDGKILGRPCTGGSPRTLNNNDKTFCGLVFYNNQTKNQNPAGVQWQGQCEVGVCKMCTNGESKCGRWICIYNQWKPILYIDPTHRSIDGNLVGQTTTALLIFFTFVFLEFHIYLIFKCLRNKEEYSSILSESSHLFKGFKDVDQLEGHESTYGSTTHSTNAHGQKL